MAWLDDMLNAVCHVLREANKQDSQQDCKPPRPQNGRVTKGSGMSLAMTTDVQ